jgi:hypothetical protein
MDALKTLYTKPNNIVSFERLKEEIRFGGYNYKALCFSKKMYIVFEPNEKLEVGVLGAIVELEKNLRLYYNRVTLFLKGNQLTILVS